MPAAFRTIKGVRCKVALLDLGKRLTETGSLQLEGARRIWESACDGNKVTETEKNSIRHIMANHEVTEEAKSFFEFWLQENEVTKCSGAGVTVIDKVKCDGAMIEVADIFTKRAAGRPLSLRAAEGVWFCALDGKGVTRKEKDTLAIIFQRYIFEDAAKGFIDNKLQWLGIAQSAEETPAVGERVAIAPDAIVLRIADALALATLPAPTQATGNPLLDARGDKGTALATLPAPTQAIAIPSSDARGNKDSHGNAKSLRPEHLQLAVVNDQSSFLSWFSCARRKQDTSSVAKSTTSGAQKRKFSGDAGQETSAQKRRKRADVPQIKLQELRQIFDKCDKDGDGLVSKREMILACRQNQDIAKFFELPTTIRQEDGSRNAVEERFQSIDINSDREISWAELLAYYRDQVVDI